MEFEARPLRVQLPCKTITVIAAEEDDAYDAQLQAHRYWQAIELATRVNLGLGDPGACEECSGNPSEPLCNNASEDLNLFANIDARVLPILRKQLEARLREIAEVEQAVAQATGSG
jgi:hypothetical protein